VFSSKELRFSKTKIPNNEKEYRENQNDNRAIGFVQGRLFHALSTKALASNLKKLEYTILSI